VSIAYRSDIDGLRAIAILTVVAFHAFPDLFPGGFIGVDVFFVISGYLITGILQQEWQARAHGWVRTEGTK
jgi:peptidoglycan/LPS O-acetylase OafA/YrhL